MDIPSIPPPVNSPQESTLLSLDDYRKKRAAAQEADPKFFMQLSGQMPFSDIDDLIEDLDGGDIVVEGVWIVSEEEPDELIAHNDNDTDKK